MGSRRRSSVSRRGFLTVVIGTAGTAALIGCARDGAPGAAPAGGETRPVDHAQGRTDVPLAPQRVVCVNGLIQEDAAALGLPVVAGVAPNLTGVIPGFIRTRLPPDFVEMGRENQVTLEGVLGQRPDLIIGNELSLEDDYAQFSQVAATVAVPQIALGQQQWVQRLEFLADATGVPERVGPAVDAVRTRSADIAARLPRPVPTLTVARVFADEYEYRTLEGSFPWAILRELGLRPPPQQEVGDPDTPQIKLGLEEARRLEADVILLAVDGTAESGESGAQFLSGLERSPLWNQVRGRRIRVDSNEVIFGGPLTAGNLLDIVERELVP